MTTPRQRPAAWVERLAALYSPVVCDVLDKLGRRSQALGPEVRPLFPGARCAGFAVTVLSAPARVLAPEQPYDLQLTAIDSLQPGDVLVSSRCDAAFWGELLSTAARYRGCTGVVVDGYCRDTPAIRAMGFPVFCRGVHPSDSLGRVETVAYNVPVVCAGVVVEPGDLILADEDGTVVVPHDLAEAVLTAAEEKVRGENVVRQKLAEGIGVVEAFRRYGIL
jgi:regulator of RNase E activity RraA